MRIIDADALKEEIEFHPTSVSVCATVEQARGETNFKLRCLEDIDNAPTIPAIPVEWLEKIQAGCVCDTVQAPMYVAIGWLIDMWQKEQEART